MSGRNGTSSLKVLLLVLDIHIVSYTGGMYDVTGRYHSGVYIKNIIVISFSKQTNKNIEREMSFIVLIIIYVYSKNICVFI